MNSYLKEIADLCLINKTLTTHVARHSYATSVCLANGVSIENVAKNARPFQYKNDAALCTCVGFLHSARYE